MSRLSAPRIAASGRVTLFVRSFGALVSVAVLTAALSACGGGGGGGGCTGPSCNQVPAPQQTVQSFPASLPLTLTSSGAAGTVGASGISATIAFAAPQNGIGTGATLTVTASTTTSGSQPQSGSRRTPLSATAVLYLTVTTSGNVSTVAMPTISTGASIQGVAFWNPLLQIWQYTYTNTSGTSYTSPGQFFLMAGGTYTFALYTGAHIAAATPTPVPGNASPLPAYPFGPGGFGWGPYATAFAFDFPVQSGYDGTNFTVAVVGDYPPSVSDIQTYTGTFGITGHSGTIATVNVDGGSPMTDTMGLGEATLDAETIAGLAPGSRIVFYATPDLSPQSFIDAFETILEQHTASVVSISFGGCESADPSAVALADEIIQQGAQAGVIFVVSSGDSGDRCNIGAGYEIGVDFPASDPNVISVGGMESGVPICNGAAQINYPRVWNNYCFNGSNQAASGGGVSSIFVLPSYQSGLSGAASSQYRNVPDVAMPADLAEIYVNGSWIDVSGTSWAAPQFAAMLTEIFEWCNLNNTALPVDAVYYPFSQNGYADFEAITSGTNQMGGDATYYAAGGTYNNATGIGAPYGMQLAQALCPSRTPLGILRRSVPLNLTAQSGLTQARSTVPNLRTVQDVGTRADGALTKVVIGIRPTSAAANAQSVAAALTSAGFTVTKIFANNLVIDAQAPASVVRTFFQTDIHDIAQGRYGTRYANTAPIIVPPAIAPYVQSVVANNLIVAVPFVGTHAHRI